MIGRIRGELRELEGSIALVEAGGVAYEIAVPDSVLVQLPAAGETVDLYTRQIFREDGVSLYGFVERFQRRLFDRLLEVKGCGPKVCIALIGQVGEDAVANAIVTGDTRVLARATGVGVRLAERIVLELKDKMPEEFLARKVDAARPTRPTKAPGDDVVDALLQLGYRRSEAEMAAAQARVESDDLQEQVRLALRALQR